MIGKALEVALATVVGCGFAAGILAGAVALALELRPAWQALAPRSGPWIVLVLGTSAGVLAGICCGMAGFRQPAVSGTALVLGAIGAASVSFVIRRQKRPAKAVKS